MGRRRMSILSFRSLVWGLLGCAFDGRRTRVDLILGFLQKLRSPLDRRCDMGWLHLFSHMHDEVEDLLLAW